MKSIAIFGPTHSGKSTLAGYILTHHLSNEDFIIKEKKNKQIIENEGNEYFSDSRLAYFVDTFKDEHYKYRDEIVSKGSSKHVKFKKYEFESKREHLLLIDSPGTDRNPKAMFKAISYADFGVYLIDLEEVLQLGLENILSSSRDYEKFFGPLRIWTNIKQSNNLVIALSKCDTVIKGENLLALKTMLMAFRAIHQLKNIPICPIGIDVKLRHGYNIFSEDERINYGMNKSLFEIITEYQLETTNTMDLYNKPFYASIESKQTPQYTGYDVLRVKVLRGLVEKGDNLVLGPVKHKKHECSVFLKVTADTFRLQGDDLNIECLGARQLGGISLNISKNNRSELREIIFSKLTVLYKDENVVKGNLLLAKIQVDVTDRSFQKELDKIGVNSTVSIVWFGKMINTIVVEKNDSEKTILELKLLYLTDTGNSSLADKEGSMFVLPLDECKKIAIDKFVLISPNGQTIIASISDIIIFDPTKTFSYCLTIDNASEELAEIIKNNYMVCQNGITKIGNTSYIIEYKISDSKKFIMLLKALRKLNEKHLKNLAYKMELIV